MQYTPDKAKIRALIRLRQAEQAEMIEYQNAKDCLMERLIRALDDPNPQPCGKCENCVGHPLLPVQFDETLSNEAAIFLQRSHRPLKPRKQWPVARMFAHYLQLNAYRIPESLLASEGMALSLWGDAGWGQMVREGRLLHHRYPDELVTAGVEMVREWYPQPTPTWITFIPPRTHAEVLANYGERLAQSLKIPLVPCVSRVRTDNKRQYQMRNSYIKAHNLDGVFAMDTGKVQRGPVILLTDVVDSRWTYTVVSALLRGAQCGAVYPFALALRDISACEDDGMERAEPCDNAHDCSCNSKTHAAIWAMAGAAPDAIQRRWRGGAFGDDYPTFTTPAECVGYLQQYALLHVPQVQAAIEVLMRRHLFGAAWPFPAWSRPCGAI